MKAKHRELFLCHLLIYSYWYLSGVSLSKNPAFGRTFFLQRPRKQISENVSGFVMGQQFHNKLETEHLRWCTMKNTPPKTNGWNLKSQFFKQENHLTHPPSFLSSSSSFRECMVYPDYLTEPIGAIIIVFS